ncbi:MAG: hypothetical protein R3D89_03695 [Sphingomonadaceae bacterium]
MKAVLPIAAALALSACSGGEEAAPAGETASTEPAAAADGPTITPEYLAGEWCYLRFEAGGEASEENINYLFAADGSLKYQTNSSTPVDMDGSWEFADGILTIKPALQFFKFVPTTITDDAMMLEAMGGQAYWKKGACGG